MQSVRMTSMDGYLTGPEVAAMMTDVGHLAEALYQANAPRRSGRLAMSTAVDVEVTRPYGRGEPRWTATLSVEAPYTASVEFGHNLPGGGRVEAQRNLQKVLQSLNL